MAGEKDRVERFLGGGGQDLVEAQERLMSRVTLSLVWLQKWDGGRFF